jgi:hypothetical protein
VDEWGENRFRRKWKRGMKDISPAGVDARKPVGRAIGIYRQNSQA